MPALVSSIGTAVASHKFHQQKFGRQYDCRHLRPTMNDNEQPQQPRQPTDDDSTTTQSRRWPSLLPSLLRLTPFFHHFLQFVQPLIMSSAVHATRSHSVQILPLKTAVLSKRHAFQALSSSSTETSHRNKPRKSNQPTTDEPETEHDDETRSRAEAVAPCSPRLPTERHERLETRQTTRLHRSLLPARPQISRAGMTNPYKV